MHLVKTNQSIFIIIATQRKAYLYNPMECHTSFGCDFIVLHFHSLFEQIFYIHLTSCYKRKKLIKIFYPLITLKLYGSNIAATSVHFSLLWKLNTIINFGQIKINLKRSTQSALKQILKRKNLDNLTIILKGMALHQSFRPFFASVHRSAQAFCSAKPIKTTLFGLTCGYAVHRWTNKSSYQISAEGEASQATTENRSTLTKDDWKQVAKEINKIGSNVKQSFEWRWYDYLMFYGITACTFGVALLFLPLWKFYFYRKHIANLRIGQLRCKLKPEFSDFFFEVFLYVTMLNFLTLGMYTVFGFANRHESYWLDTNVEWFIDSNDFEKKKENFVQKKNKTFVFCLRAFLLLVVFLCCFAVFCPFSFERTKHCCQIDFYTMLFSYKLEQTLRLTVHTNFLDLRVFSNIAALFFVSLQPHSALSIFYKCIINNFFLCMSIYMIKDLFIQLFLNLINKLYIEGMAISLAVKRTYI
ncbi:hypothetical protein RFI_28334 [Reticulomyxa filosa]|uniref:Uncharacterized protein n=1 Tax=Reticulomyxa filosa TaxID=46433 RepID=X6M6G2_RETFI|nr:hypothetical protein RFI_28334 [Reticulomyxa filosa]|eukprot:ETO09052.1 hypothetical protein RFI_28334 [Reticulomyxa filosa]